MYQEISILGLKGKLNPPKGYHSELVSLKKWKWLVALKLTDDITEI